MKAIYKNEHGTLYISDITFTSLGRAIDYYGDKYTFIGILNPERILTDVSK